MRTNGPVSWRILMALALSVCIYGGASRAQESAEAPSRTVKFSTSCRQSVDSEFNRAVELLHSFEYPESERVFRSILNTDPDCGMARWGVAMNRWHPLWALPSEADLATGSEMLSQIDVAMLTEREAGYVAALCDGNWEAEVLPLNYTRKSGSYGLGSAG
jgi:hypothetical protein